MATGPNKDNRGGYRPNAGRKPGPGTTLGAAQVSRLLRKARRFAKLHGKDHNDVLFEILYSTEEKTADRLAAIKHLNDIMVPKIQEGGAADKQLGPSIFLPEQRPPELAVIHGGKPE